MSIVEQEEWRAIPGFEGYEASNYGKIRSLDRVIKGRELKLGTTNCGYSKVDLFGKTVNVHRLTATAFLGHIPDGMVVNHKDGVKSNNRADNLELVSSKENTAHAIRTGLRNGKGESHGCAKLTDNQVIEIRSITGKTEKVIAKQFGVSKSLVHMIRSGRVWKHLLPQSSE